jgi:hypothetical protein
MKFLRTLLPVSALLVVAAIMTACGGGGATNSRGVPGQPPPPPTGANYTTCQDNAGNSQLVPNFLSSQFQTNYQNAISNLITHVSHAPYAAQVGYIRIGLGRGGEINLPNGWNNSSSGVCYGGYFKWGYTAGSPSATWDQYLAGMLSFEGSLSSPKQLLVSITPISSSGIETDDYIAPIAVQNGISYGNQGLQASDITAFGTGGACGGDWCKLFEQSPPVIKELQTIGQSCPQGAGACTSQQQSSTGPLPPLLQFATGVGGSGIPIVPAPGNDLELYYQDWLIAYDPTDPDNGTYGAAYKSAIEAASAHATMQVLFPDPSNSDIPTYVLSQSSVTGVVIDVDWSDIQPTSAGSFDWTITDASIQRWISAGAKKVNLVFQNTTYAGNNCGQNSIGSNGQSSSGNCAMPAWMWTVLQ